MYGYDLTRQLELGNCSSFFLHGSEHYLCLGRRVSRHLIAIRLNRTATFVILQANIGKV